MEEETTLQETAGRGLIKRNKAFSAMKIFGHQGELLSVPAIFGTTANSKLPGSFKREIRRGTERA